MRAASSRAAHAFNFLLASARPDTKLDDHEFHDAVWMRLGMPAAVGHTDCSPPPVDDPGGLHRLGCKAAADARHRRHDALAAVIAKAALDADPRAFRVERDVAAPDDDATRARPGDIAVDLGDGRTPVDVTVVLPVSAAPHLNASRSAGSPAVAAVNTYNRKVTK